jgi:uncharacterized protein (TIGR03546 family)
MIRQLLRPVRLVAKALAAENSPRQLALGFALGMVIGLVPKGNLIAIGLTLILFGTRVNVGAGLVAAVLFSWLGVYLDPAADDLGHWLLSDPSLHGLWTSLYNLPLTRWSGFNNTVVLGGLGLGLVLFYPAYEISRLFFARAQPPVVSWIRKYKLTRVLFGVELAANWRVG